MKSKKNVLLNILHLQEKKQLGCVVINGTWRLNYFPWPDALTARTPEEQDVVLTHNL